MLSLRRTPVGASFQILFRCWSVCLRVSGAVAPSAPSLTSDSLSQQRAARVPQLSVQFQRRRSAIRHSCDSRRAEMRVRSVYALALLEIQARPFDPVQRLRRADAPRRPPEAHTTAFLKPRIAEIRRRRRPGHRGRHDAGILRGRKDFLLRQKERQVFLSFLRCKEPPPDTACRESDRPGRQGERIAVRNPHH